MREPLRIINFSKAFRDDTPENIEARLRKYHEPGCIATMRLLLRRTLVRLESYSANWQWQLGAKRLQNFIVHCNRLLSVIVIL